MYSGLLPKGLSEADLSTDEEEDLVQNNSQIGETNRRNSDQLNDFVPSVLEETPVLTTESHCMTVSHQSIDDIHISKHESNSSDCLPGIRPDMWQKFKDLQMAKDIQKVKEPKSKRQKKKRSQKGKEGPQRVESNKTRQVPEEGKKHWEGLTKYFGSNDRFEPPPCSRPSPKSGLEKSIESAIAEGNYGKAEDLSDKLATRELAVKIAQAADCRDYAQTQQEAEASRAAQRKRKQVAWGFEAKRRWETKSNMGYM